MHWIAQAQRQFFFDTSVGARHFVKHHHSDQDNTSHQNREGSFDRNRIAAELFLLA
jgi:hypothetical protein